MCLPSVLPKLPGDEGDDGDDAAPDGPQEELGLGRDEAGMRGRLISSIESSRAERKKTREAILKMMFALVKKIQERERASKGALPRKMASNILFLRKRSWVLAGMRGGQASSLESFRAEWKKTREAKLMLALVQPRLPGSSRRSSRGRGRARGRCR